MLRIDSGLPNIADVLRHYGANLRQGRGQVNLKCPFHSDTHQSGSANLDKNIFICFACGVQGNSLQIIAQHEVININEARTFAEGITGEGNQEVRGKYSSGIRLPRKQGNQSGSSTSGVIRRGYGA